MMSKKTRVVSGVLAGVLFAGGAWAFVFSLGGISEYQYIPEAQLNEYPAPEIVPPAGHPRVLVRPQHLDVIRARRATGENAEAWTEVLQLSTNENDTLIAGLVTVDSSSMDLTPLMVVRAKALRYLLDEDAALGAEAVDLAERLLINQQFEDGDGVTRSIGKLIYSCALVYDWCYELMDTDLRVDFVLRFEELAAMMETEYPPYNQGAVTGHGSEAQILRDMLATSIAVYDERPEMYRMTAGRFFAEFIEPRDFFYESGRHHQGNSYIRLRYGAEMWSAWLFRRMSGVDVYDESQGDVLYSLLYTRRPDGQLLRDGDSSQTSTYWRYEEPLFLATSYYSDPVLLSECERQDLSSLIDDQPALFVLLNDPSLESVSQSTLPLTRFRDGPLASMQCRTGWGDDSVVTDLMGAGVQFNNHDHLDAGTFQIYYKGALAHDPGVYGSSYGSAYDMSVNKRSISHNVMLVYDPNEEFPRGGNDGGQRFPNDAREPQTLEELLSSGYNTGEVFAHAVGPDTNAPAYSYMKVDLADAYSDKVQSYTRTFCFLNMTNDTNPATLIVLDRISSAQEDFSKHWILHTVEEPTITNSVIDVQRTEPPYSGRMVVSTLLPEQTNIDVYGGTGQTVDVFGVSYELPFERAEAPGWRIHVQPSVAATNETFLNVLQMMDATGADPLPVQKEEGDGWLGARIADSLVVFSDSDALLEDDVEISVTNQTQLLITDLAAGSWELKEFGATNGIPATVGAGGTLFTAVNAGTWILGPE